MTRRSSVIFIVFVFVFLSMCIRDVLPETEVGVGDVQLLVRAKTKMTNRMTCREMYDHCVDGKVSGDRGQRSTSSDKWPPNRMNKTTFALSRCFCDVGECRKYGDCCPDIVLPEIEKAAIPADADDVHETNLVDTMRNHDLECQGFIMLYQSKRKYYNIYMRTSCPRTWEEEGVDDLCRRQVSSSSLYDYTLDVPVISHATNVTYRNIYCAICNEDTALVQLTISIHCPPLQKNCSDDFSQWQYVAGKQRWSHVNNTIDGHPTNMTFELLAPDKEPMKFFAKHGVRVCVRGLVSTCPSHWIGDVERHLCAAYALIVSHGTPEVRYKNRHCATCNGIAADAKMSCPPAKDARPGIEDGRNERPLTHSYSMLVDFMGNDFQRSGGMTCGYGEICDALRKRCRPFTCGRHFRLDDSGHCVSIQSEATNNDGRELEADVQLFLLLDCPKVTFYDGQFVFLSNDTIYVNETDTVYNVGNYELVNESMILVCASLANDAAVWKFTDANAILSTVCVLVSLTCLGVHILVHIYLPQLRNLPGKNLLSLSIALFVAQFLFTFGMSTMSEYPVACVTVAAIIHLCFLATFFWMNVMAFDVCRTFSSKSYLPSSTGMGSGNCFLKYSLYAWLTPSIIVALALINDLVEFLPSDVQPKYAGHDVCWIGNNRALLVFFVAPLALLVANNTVLFVATVVGILRTTKATKFARQNPSSSSLSSSGSGRRKTNTDRLQIVLYVKLALIMGLTWLFGLVASLAKVQFLWYLFIVFNALQGAFIFFAFTFKAKILRMAQDRFSGKMVTRGSKGNSFCKTQVTSKSVQSYHNVTHASTVPCSL